MRIEVRTTETEKQKWQSIAKNKGVSLSELIRSTLNRQRLSKRHAYPSVSPDLLRELARMGNNLNQIARAVNGRQPVESIAIVARLIEIDRELSELRKEYSRPVEKADVD